MANTMVYGDEDQSTVAVGGDADGSNAETPVASASPEKPRRNLTKDFALCMENGVVIKADAPDKEAKADTDAPVATKIDKNGSMFSPTSVIPPETQQKQLEEEKTIPPYHFDIHESLRRGLSQALVDRVSFYGIIHDINKEASSMAMHDPKQPSPKDNVEDREESGCALVKAAIVGTPTNETNDSEDVATALIDEEAWLLEIVGNRDPEERTSTVCPPTFSQAMGEREYENPVQALSGASRTQLWKPSRSWWEAKSGKNPWIEPSSHNKRWRYLWPLIHYHKFLAKCIKKLKRNGVDVKHAVSPVAVFLREEVCAVSDHLSDCSRFDSDEWMAVLVNFHGWAELDRLSDLQSHIRQLKLRPLDEPADVESKLLRDQVDRHFLCAMAKARAQLREGSEQSIGSSEASSRARGQPPMYPRSTLRADATPVSRSGMPLSRRQQSPIGQHDYHGPHPTPHHAPYWAWEQQSMAAMVTPYGDNSSVHSVHSAMSADSSFAQPYPAYMHPMPPHAYHPHYYPGHMVYPHRSHRYKVGEHVPEHQDWIDPSSYGTHMYHTYPTPMAHTIPSEVQEHHDEDVSEGTDLVLPPSEGDSVKNEATPAAKLQRPSQQQSPFWSHLDSVAAGLATPAKLTPGTPRRPVSHDEHDSEDHYNTSAQPLLLRGYHHYGNYMAREGYAPPSPATQFMMSPQPNFAPGYAYPYALSPGGAYGSPRKKSLYGAPNTGDLTPPPVRKIVATHDAARESPTTVGTTTETESLHESTAASTH